jgi:hypothetical protein
LSGRWLRGVLLHEGGRRDLGVSHKPRSCTTRERSSRGAVVVLLGHMVTNRSLGQGRGDLVVVGGEIPVIVVVLVVLMVDGVLSTVLINGVGSGGRDLMTHRVELGDLHHSLLNYHNFFLLLIGLLEDLTGAGGGALLLHQHGGADITSAAGQDSARLMNVVRIEHKALGNMYRALGLGVGAALNFLGAHLGVRHSLLHQGLVDSLLVVNRAGTAVMVGGGVRELSGFTKSNISVLVFKDNAGALLGQHLLCDDLAGLAAV